VYNKSNINLVHKGLQMSEHEGFEAGDERAQQWQADRALEATPLPHAEDRRYKSEADRQEDLAAAESSNIARAAADLGLTSVEWNALRSQLGRSPQRGDVDNKR
jgi:hypothetical protein